MTNDSTITVSKLWILAPIVPCVIAFLWGSKTLLMAYMTNSVEKWPLFALAMGIYLVILLVIIGAFDLCSVKLNSYCVTKTKLFYKGHFFVTQELPWQEITSAMVRPGTYRLSSPSVAIEIHTMVFSNPMQAANYVQSMLPDRVK